jgi:hypothetical protein
VGSRIVEESVAIVMGVRAKIVSVFLNSLASTSVVFKIVLTNHRNTDSLGGEVHVVAQLCDPIHLLDRIQW